MTLRRSTPTAPTIQKVILVIPADLDHRWILEAHLVAMRKKIIVDWAKLMNE